MSIRPTLAIAMHDGFYGAGTGAGHSNYAFLRTAVAHLAQHVRLVVMPVRLDPVSPERDPRWHHQVLDLLRARRAIVLPVDNGTGGRQRFGGLAQFQRVVEHTAHVLSHHVVPHGDPLAIIAFDAPFLGLACRLAPQARRHVTIVPRSTSALHDPGSHSRISWEQAGLTCVTECGGRVGCISGFMRSHLHSEYDLPLNALIDAPVALTRDEMTFGSPDPALLPYAAREGFLFAMGRAEPYKGWDDLLDALALLQEQRQIPHAILAAVTDYDPPTGYQAHLADRIRHQQIRATLITRFDSRVRQLLTHSALAGVIVPSRVEPFGRIPLEAHSAGACPVVATSAGGLAEQIVDGHTGFLAHPGNPASLAASIARALDLGSVARERMRHEAQRRAVSRDASTLNLRFLNCIADWAIA